MPKQGRRHFGSVVTRAGRRGFYLRIRYRGQQRLRRSGPSRTVAAEQLSKIHVAVARGMDLDTAIDEVLGRPTNVLPPREEKPAMPTFAEVAERYMKAVVREKRVSTRREDRRRLDTILTAAWAQKPIDQIGKGEIATWIDERGASGNGGRGLAPSTLNRYRSTVSVVFEHAMERDLIETNPARGLKRADESKRGRDVFLTSEEIQALLRRAPDELRLVILTAATTGLRQGALRQLRWADVDLEVGTLLAQASYAKAKKPQYFHLIPEVVEELKQLRGKMTVRSMRGTDAVFQTKTGKQWSTSWLCHLMRRTVDGCVEIPAEKRKQVTFHTLRHSFASLLAMDGMNTRKLQEALAHSDSNLTARYSHLGSEAMVEVQQRIARILKPGQDQVREGYHRGYQSPKAG